MAIITELQICCLNLFSYRGCTFNCIGSNTAPVHSASFLLALAWQASGGGGGAASKRSLQTAEDIGRKAWMPGSVSAEGDERVNLELSPVSRFLVQSSSALEMDALFLDISCTRPKCEGVQYCCSQRSWVEAVRYT